MKNIKKIAAFAGGIFGVLFANPFVAMAATEAPQKKSLGARMMTALLNTVMGILIVFIVIAWIISLFKYINKFEANQAAKKAAQRPMPAVPVPVPTVEEEEDLSDDLELVAVVTAAIHAYEEAEGIEVPADGLVIRSIRKVGKANWRNA